MNDALAQIAVGAIFTDGEPGVRVWRRDVPEGPVVCVAMTILDAAEPIGHAVALYEQRHGADADLELQDLRARIARLGGTPGCERVWPIKAPVEPVRFIVRHLLACQADRLGGEATRSG